MINERDRQTDRQTDVQTPHDSIDRACIASRGKNRPFGAIIEVKIESNGIIR